MLCDRCHQPLPVMLFPGAPKERQAVFTVQDGKRVHIGPCPATEPTQRRRRMTAAHDKDSR